MEIVLGSSSPRRKLILESLFGPLRTEAPDTDESRRQGESPGDYAVRIAEEKSCAVARALPVEAGTVIITADTVVALGGLILGKPRNREDAEGTLAMLSGKTHRVITALTLRLRSRDGEAVLSGLETTEVRFRDFGESVARTYLDGIEFLDKAGSYAIQENGEMIVRDFSGSLSNIIGFPLRLFFSMASDLGIIEDAFGLPRRAAAPRDGRPPEGVPQPEKRN